MLVHKHHPPPTQILYFYLTHSGSLEASTSFHDIFGSFLSSLFQATALHKPRALLSEVTAAKSIVKAAIAVSRIVFVPVTIWARHTTMAEAVNVAFKPNQMYNFVRSIDAKTTGSAGLKIMASVPLFSLPIWFSLVLSQSFRLISDRSNLAQGLAYESLETHP
jgi:hypothetical protein